MNVCNFPILAKNESRTCRRKVKTSTKCFQHQNVEEPPLCTICQEYVFPKNPTMEIPCKHIFHKKCLHKHIRNSPLPVCPNCRCPIDNVYSISVMEILLPTFHIVQHTSESDLTEDIKRDREIILKSLIEEWLERMFQNNYTLVAIHVGDLPVDPSIITNKYETSFIPELNLFLVKFHNDLQWPS